MAEIRTGVIMDDEQQNQDTMEIANILEDNQQIEILQSPNIRDENFRHIVKKMANAVKNVYDRLDRLSPELKMFLSRLKNITHRPAVSIIPHIDAWIDKRAELIKLMNSSADEMDDSFFRATCARLFGSSMDLFYNIDSICGKEISGFLTEQAFGISNLLGLVTQTVCSYVPYLTYVGFFGSLGDVMKSQLINRYMLKVLKEDILLLDEIQDFIADTDKLDKDIQKMLSFVINSDLVSDIQNYFPDCDIYSKIFVLTYIAAVGRNPGFMRDIQGDSSIRNQFLHTIHLFSESDVAAEWFERNLKIDHDLVTDARKFEFRKELMGLSNFPPDPESTLEIGGQVVKMKTVPHLVQASINCISIYFTSKQLMQGVKHKNSDLLRELAKSARSCLENMTAIKDKIESS